jgi:hypothetical protein
LDSNAIGELGADALARALRQNGTLRSLDLSNNQIPPPALLNVLRPIQATKCLTELSLRQNKVNDVAVQLLCDMITTTKMKIVKVDLAQNEITERGVCFVCKASIF